MNKKMCITYEVENSLYINMTNRCSNSCTFCIRNNGDTAYGSDSLWLEREPSVEEVLDAVFLRDVPKYDEVVFCGYGEPSYRLSDARVVALKIKQKYPDAKVRINTNGQSDLILGVDSSELYKDAFDAVSISLNASNGTKYMEICRPVYKNSAFPAIIKFAENVKKCVPKVVFSVVRETLDDIELYECEKIAERTGVPLKVRAYIGKEG